MPAVPRILGGHILPSRASWQDERTHGQTANPCLARRRATSFSGQASPLTASPAVHSLLHVILLGD
jgi:hypothetical protein